MTEPERPAVAPSTSPGPTPEEISARLEALLKRTHALRAQQPPPGASLNITWPPPDRELDHYDVVDVPEDDRMQAQATPPAAPSSSAPVAPTSPPQAETATSGGGTGEFARPDWSELRLRGGQDEPQPRRSSLWMLTALLALATIGQAGYLWYLHAQGGARVPGQLRVDGPEGAEVRVNGRAIGPAPIEHALEPGDYDVEVVADGGRGRAERISIGVGRTVVLLPLAAAAATAPPPGAATPAATTRPAPIGGVVPPPRGAASSAVAPAGSPNAPPRPPTAPAAVAAAVSPTLGAVLIESTPPGLPVTMEGRERGVTPITIGQLRPGRHDVLVGGLARQVDVTANQVATLRVTRR